MATTLKFVPFTSSIDSAFWQILSQKKLEEYRLQDDPVSIRAHYCNNYAVGIPSLFQLDFSSFARDFIETSGQYVVHGEIHNTNTIDQFKLCNKNDLMQTVGCKIWNAIVSGEALTNPQLLSRFVLITHANLKKYEYHYWFGFPALCPEESVSVCKPASTIGDLFSPAQVQSFLLQYDANFKLQNIPFFVILLDGNHNEIRLVRLSNLDIKNADLKDLVFVFCDPSTYDLYPGWVLRNYLCLISKQFVTSSNSIVRVLGLRDRTVNGIRQTQNSVYMEVLLSPIESGADMWNVIGWEKNDQQKLLPRYVNMSKTMDPTHLAASAVDLNLKLMRWRLLPNLDLESISQTKCLLLGAGTLGCNIARNLLGWGIKHITFVDNSSVSYSNPVRQSLYTFEDCLEGGKSKAQAAADSLHKIFPLVTSRGISLTIPMPGHPVEESLRDSVLNDINTLEQLVDEHDAIFLLMDTRESRWLPTVLGAAKNKIVLTAALGFDSWVAMRHGVREKTSTNVVPDDRSTNMESATGDTCPTSNEVPGHDLGCYYCNDVVAPRDSTKDRTLDQQCTVTRPGISMVCSALIVELLVSIVQHPSRGLAPAYIMSDENHDSAEESVLGIIPHQIRGYLSQYQLILPVSRKFKNCTACSDIVVKHYLQEGAMFLFKVFEDAKYLEVISGLEEMHLNPLGNEVMSDFDADDDDW